MNGRQKDRGTGSVVSMPRAGAATRLVDIDLEAQIIGAVLSDGAQWPSVSFLQEEHFSDPAHRRIWRAFGEICGSGQKISSVSISLSMGHEFEDLGGRTWLSALASLGDLVSMALVDAAEQLRQMAQWRQLSGMLKIIQELVEKRDCTSEEAFSRVIQSAQQSLASGRPTSRTKREVARAAITDALSDRTLVTTGITDLDYLMQGGIQRRRLYGIGGLFGRGKTILVGTVSENLNIDGVKHCVISLETPPEDVEIRNCARALKLNASQIFDTGDRMHHRFAGNAKRYIDEMTDHTVYEYLPGATYHEIQRAILQAKHRHGIEGFILDYWQLIRGREKGQSEQGHLRNVADLLASICRRENLWGIITVQADQYGVPTICPEGPLTACSLYVCLKRDENGSVAWFETMKSNHTRYADTGHAGAPNMIFDHVGPHFRDARGEDISMMQHDEGEGELPH